MWANEQNENDFFDFCRVVNDQKVIQLDDSVANAVTTRRQNPNRTDSDVPQKKQMKSVVS